jgi:hypothetical protein
VIESPLRDTSSLSARGSSYSQGGSQTFGSLPSRQKQPGSQSWSSNSAHGSVGQRQQGVSSSSGNPSPRTDDNGLWTNLNMDISPDRQASGSDKASPTTMNSSSNAAFTPPGLCPQLQSNNNTGDSHQHPSKPVTNPNITFVSPTPENFPADVSSFPQYFDAVADTPRDPTGMENPFSMPAGWEPPIAQPSSTLSANDVAGQEAGSDLMGSEQFDLMLQEMGWNGWRQ